MNNAEFFIGNRKVTGKVFLICFLSVLALNAAGHSVISRLEDCFVKTVTNLVSDS